MENAEQIINYFKGFTTTTIIDIMIAIGIIIIFCISSSGIAHLITRILKRKMKKSEIKKSGIYITLKKFFKIMGIYIAVMFLKGPLMINTSVILIIRKIFKVIVIFIIAKVISECVTLDGIKRRSSNKESEGVTSFIVRFIKAIIYVIATFIAVLELGYDLSGLITGLGISSVVITLAAQDLAKDILGGLVIFSDKPFKVGDWIQFSTYEGTVEDITLRSTRIRTFENYIVNVPNSLISSTSIINCSRIEKRRYKINLQLELDTPLSVVKTTEEKIRTMLKEKENVMDDSVIVKFDKITDNGINLLIYAFTDSVDYESFLKEKEDINYKIMQILQSEKVELAYDTKTVYMRK